MRVARNKRRWPMRRLSSAADVMKIRHPRDVQALPHRAWRYHLHGVRWRVSEVLRTLIRTAVLGHASDEARRLADQSLKTLQLLYKNIRPGRTMDEVARATSAAAPLMDGETRTRGYLFWLFGRNWLSAQLGRALDRRAQQPFSSLA